MKKNFPQIRKQYKFDEAMNVYLIEVSLDDYDDVYDDWDPAPFKKRFIEEEFDEFIVSSSEDIPIKYNLNIVLYIPEQMKDTNKEKAVQSAYKNYYSYNIAKIENEWTKLKKKSFLYFVLAVLFLSSGYFFQYGMNSVLLEVLKEGIFVGGWVFLWEVFTNEFITRREYQVKHKLYKRLYLSEIRFIYTI